MRPRRPPRSLLARNTFADAGDEAILARELQRLRDRFPGTALTLLTDDPEGAARRHGVDVSPDPGRAVRAPGRSERPPTAASAGA